MLPTDYSTHVHTELILEVVVPRAIWITIRPEARVPAHVNVALFVQIMGSNASRDSVGQIIAQMPFIVPYHGVAALGSSQVIWITTF